MVLANVELIFTVQRCSEVVVTCFYAVERVFGVVACRLLSKIDILSYSGLDVAGVCLIVQAYRIFCPQFTMKFNT